MKLYYSKGACSLAVRIIINELGINATYEAVDLKTKQTESGENFLTINPKGAVPTLITDQHVVLTENVVIQQFLADTHHEVGLLPQVPDIKRYKVLEWQNFVATDLHKGFGPLFNPKVPEEIKQKVFYPMLKNKFTFVDEHLSHHLYLLGDSFTLPDAYLMVVLRWAMHFKLGMDEWKSLSRYFDEMRKRPGVAKSFLEEGLE